MKENVPEKVFSIHVTFPQNVFRYTFRKPRLLRNLFAQQDIPIIHKIIETNISFHVK